MLRALRFLRLLRLRRVARTLRPLRVLRPLRPVSVTQAYWQDVECTLHPAVDLVRGASGGSRRSAAERAEHQRQTMQAVGAFTRTHAHPAASEQRYVALVAEFVAYLREFGADGRNSLESCTDIEVLVFFEGHYRGAHEGRECDEVAGSTLVKAVGQLRRAFVERGRDGPWACMEGGCVPTGNPADSIRVTSYVLAYQKYCVEEGRQEQSAAPMKLAQYVALMEGLKAELDQATREGRAGSEQDAQKVIRLARDAAAFALIWQSCRRGADVLSVQWGGLFSETGVPMLQEWGRLECPNECGVQRMYVVPRKTKTEQTTRPSTQVIPAETSDKAHLCAVKTLGWLYVILVAYGRSVSAEDYVFSGYSNRDSGALTSSALLLRLKRAVQLYVEQDGGKGLTVHSFRRGRLQYERYERLVGLEELGLLAGIKDLGVLHRYLDRGRHLV